MVVLLFLLILVLWEFVPLLVGTSYAVGSVEDFEAEVRSSMNGSPDVLLLTLQSIVSNYPSGSRLPKNSKPDMIVEAARRTAEMAIISELRRKTGKDFGSDPKEWIDKLGARE
jgi:hypothetical protein